MLYTADEYFVAMQLKGISFSYNISDVSTRLNSVLKILWNRLKRSILAVYFIQLFILYPISIHTHSISS
jgi:hypothetical protein